MEKKALLNRLKGIGQKTSSPKTTDRIAPTEPERKSPPEPLPADQIACWEGQPLSDELLGEVQIPTVSAALPGRLGHFPFWRGNEPFHEALVQIYDQASPQGLALILGGDGSGRELAPI